MADKEKLNLHTALAVSNAKIKVPEEYEASQPQNAMYVCAMTNREK